ncbi:hypothetical protein ACROYT_G032594 [Oculina patagonica]
MADEGEKKEVRVETTTLAKKTSKRSLKRLQIEAASKLTCKLCPNKKFTSLKMYDDHMASKKHRKKKSQKETAGAWVCQACDLVLSSQSEWVKHLCGRRHHDKLKEWSVRLFPTTYPVTQQEIDLLDDSHYEEIEEDEEEDGGFVE